MDLGTILAESCARNPDALAIVDADARRSFAAWYGDIRAIAGGLQGLGLKRGDRLAAVMPNRFEMASLYWACQLTGLIFTPYNWRATAEEIAFVLADAEAKAVAFDAQTADVVGAAADAVGLDRNARILVDDAEGTRFATLAGSAPVDGPAGAEENDICLMLYTSGTTGRPKGVPRTHRAERIAAESCIANQHYREGESALGVMPLFHTMGIRILLASMMLGGKFVCMRAFEVEAALGLIAAERLTTLFLVPTMYHDMLGHPRFTDYDCASVRNLGYAGMAMTGALEDKCRALLRPEIFCNYYGSTEIFTFTTCDYLDRKPGCAGRAGRNQKIRVVVADPDGGAGPNDVLAPGEVGEVIATMSSPEAFQGYWKWPDADARAIRDGWYFTGDLGILDEDGELTLAGRVDDMIISGGENIHPEEVEDILDASPLVR
jgi:2-furoate---CoA ligase